MNKPRYISTGINTAGITSGILLWAIVIQALSPWWLAVWLPISIFSLGTELKQETTNE